MPTPKSRTCKPPIATRLACAICLTGMSGLVGLAPTRAETAELPPAAHIEHQLIRILPLGDSITQGGRNDRPEYTYRYPLYFMLKDAGYDIDFIGSLRTGLHPDAVWPDKNGVPFDLDHEGHYGWRTGETRDHLREWMTHYPAAPDIVMLDLGSNDEDASDYQTAIIKPLEDIVAILREKNPKVVVLLGHFLANGRTARSIRPLMEQMARETSTPESPVITVLHYKNWHERPDLPYTDTFDWAHPNLRGQEKMAKNYFEAMRPYLNRMIAGQ
jgi:acyl-CoA thioesterase-1